MNISLLLFNLMFQRKIYENISNDSESDHIDDNFRVSYYKENQDTGNYEGNCRSTGRIIKKIVNNNQNGDILRYEVDTISVRSEQSKKPDNQEKISCRICFDKSGIKENYIILSCNHVFHIQCLAETHFQDIYKYPVIDNEYFMNRKCKICNNNLQTEEIMFLHGKFLSNTKTQIEKHQFSIERLEDQHKIIKEELRVCYDYKHKLESEREKSKQIVSILTTMM
jgi:hypothetical protein